MAEATAVPQFSIIMNVYNGAPYLRAAINSVLAQTCCDWELILFDDCSTDESPTICRGYDDPRIRYARAETQVPVAQAREQAMRLARGPWLAFLDQDDIWLPHKLEAQEKRIDRDTTGNLGLVYGRTYCFDAQGRQWPFDRWSGPNPQPEGAIATLLLERPSFINLSSVVLLRGAALAALPMPAYVNHCPDYHLCLAVAQRHRAACVQELCTLYRVHPDSMSHRFLRAIHVEVLEIIRHAAGPEHAAIVRRRNTVHQTWIAVDEIVSGPARLQGLRRLLLRGSSVYLAGRPLLHLGRRLGQHAAARLWKYRGITLLRRLGLLAAADRVKLAAARLKSWGRNRRFRRADPDFAVPPSDLAFDAYNTIDWQAYRDGGLAQARAFADLIARHGPPRPMHVLEWGCGPGRLIRHIPGLLGNRAASVTGSDYNPRSVAWCRANLPGIAFLDNALMPPLPVAAGSFDAIYCFSVLTHLSASVQAAWMAEVQRILAPGGLLVCTTHGAHFRYLLTDAAEQQRYAAGEMVEQAQYDEGRKWYFAIHPPNFVRDRLLSGFDDVHTVPTPPQAGILQDVWIARKLAA